MSNADTPHMFSPYDWLDEAVIYNKRYEIIPSEWIRENTDVLVLLFSARGTDRNGIVEKFYEIYENVKFLNLPIEVIYVPLEETEEEMKQSFEKQANWFTLKPYDPLVLKLKYMYDITCIPHILVLKIDGTIISTHGMVDLEQYGKNAILTWLSTSASSKNHRKLSKDAAMYGDKWNYINAQSNTSKHDSYLRKFSIPETL
ncbi:uncharacterized protein LOC116413357 [Galleria mellonella]|uniref:Uncharacterized protein LOC116413357 n=1 Tax=Galleria mellonella TaxID=7137 RepID=A0A6J3C584_GALME|nr:uncharacterized protein LOC116413357 [Galleria mellonella]